MRVLSPTCLFGVRVSLASGLGNCQRCSCCCLSAFCVSVCGKTVGHEFARTQQRVSYDEDHTW